MSNWHSSCVRRYDLERASSAVMKWLIRSRISNWLVPGKPCGLSVTANCNLLVACREPNKLVELSAVSGQSVREIALQSNIRCLWHSVQLTTEQHLVAHGLSDSDLQRVCVVGDDGKVTRSYGGQRGSDVGQLNCPCHLAVDKDSQFIFVADNGNNRVVLLSPTLEFIRHISVTRPSSRLYFHQATRRLFVGHWYDGVTVIQL